jgi:hypothetical protein
VLILAILLVFLIKHSRGTSACPIYPMQKTKTKHSWSPLPNLFHRVTGNYKHTIIFLGLTCMHLLPHVCIKIFLISLMCEKKMDSLLTDIKNPKPPSPPSLIKLLVSNKENKWVGRHVTPLGHINTYSDSGQSLFLLLNAACFNSREATDTNFIVFGLTRLGLYPVDLTHSMRAC